MPLAPLTEIIGPARAAGRGVGAFNVIGIEHAEAIARGAEAADASGLPYRENVQATAEVTEWCHGEGIWVEAELGEIGGKNGVHSPLARTDPGEAAEYVAATGVDALAVAIGSSHAMLTRDAILDLGLVAAIRGAVGVPLVLHGSSGVPDRDLAAAVGAGMTKINIATQLNKVFTAAVRAYLAAEPAAVDPRRYGAAGRDAVTSEVTRLLDLLGADSAAAVDAIAMIGGADESLSTVE